jgi:hypothetical protein
MNSIITLRKELINKIAVIEDINLLKAIKTILEYQATERSISLPADIEQELLQTSKQVKSGFFISQDELDKKVESWLKEG